MKKRKTRGKSAWAGFTGKTRDIIGIATGLAALAKVVQEIVSAWRL